MHVRSLYVQNTGRPKNKTKQYGPIPGWWRGRFGLTILQIELEVTNVFYENAFANEICRYPT